MTTTTERVDGAAQHLVAARHAGSPGPLLPDALRPENVETALAIQQRVADLLGEPVGGWKCALPPPDRVILAPIFASTIREADAPYRVVGGPIVRIEPEIAFVLDRDLPAREQPYDEQDVRTAIREVRIVLEVLGCRYAGPRARRSSSCWPTGNSTRGCASARSCPTG